MVYWGNFTGIEFPAKISRGFKLQRSIKEGDQFVNVNHYFESYQKYFDCQARGDILVELQI